MPVQIAVRFGIFWTTGHGDQQTRSTQTGSQIQRRGDNQINPTTHTVRRRLWVNASCKGRRDVKMGTHGKCMVGPRPW